MVCDWVHRFYFFNISLTDLLSPVGSLHNAQVMAYYFDASYSKLGFGESCGLSLDMSTVSTHKKFMSKN